MCNSTPQYKFVHVPVPQILEQSAVTSLVNEQFLITAFEVSQVVDSFSLAEEFVAPAEVTTLNTCSTSTSSSAPVYNRIRQKLCDAEETTQSPVEVFILSSTSTISDDVAKILDCLQNIEKATERAAMLTERMMEPPMMEAPVVECERTSAKRRRRTRHTPLPGILENAVYLAPITWPPTRRA